MNREFVMAAEFDRQWQKMGLGDTELSQLQEMLQTNPKAGKVIRGTNGLRKVRISFGKQGKRGGGRVAYVDFTVHKKVYLLTAYPKNIKDNLSKEERNLFAKVIVGFERELTERYGPK